MAPVRTTEPVDAVAERGGRVLGGFGVILDRHAGSVDLLVHPDNPVIRGTTDPDESHPTAREPTFPTRRILWGCWVDGLDGAWHA